MSIAKKIFIISSVLLAAVLFFMGIYNIAFKEKKIVPQSTTEAPKKEESGILEKIGEKIGIGNEEKIYPLSKVKAIAPVLTDKGEKIIFYDQATGSVYKVSLTGDEEELVDENNFSGLESVLWSQDRSKVVSLFNKNGKSEYSFYDYNSKKAVKLAEGMESVVLNNLQDGIAYKFTDSRRAIKTLNIANFDGSNWKKIADVSQNNISILAVPQTSFISFWNSPNAFEETSLFLVSVIAGEPRKIFSGRYGAEYLWSPNGTKALVSSSDSKGGTKIQLGIINSNGGEYQNLNVPTFASKCVWSKDSKTVFYALPSFSGEGNVLPNDYSAKKIFTKDTFWKMDVATGKTDRVVNIEEIKNSYDATGMFLSEKEDILFFINRIDGKLYGINL